MQSLKQETTEENTTGESTEAVSEPNTVSCEYCFRPDYPAEALEAGAEGTPVVRVTYDKDGKVVDVSLERSSGNAALDRAAIEAARDYRFKTTDQSGSVSIEIDFGIEASTARQGGERMTSPPTRADDLAVTMETPPVVRIEYDENGNVIGAIIERSSGSTALDRATLEVARRIALEAGEQTGSVPIEVEPEAVREEWLRSLLAPLNAEF